MISKSLLAALSLLIFLPLSALAQGTSVSSLAHQDETKMPGSFRLGFMASGIVAHPKEKYENKDVIEDNNGSVTLFGAIGRGRVTFETGASYVQMSEVVPVQATDKTWHSYAVNSRFGGVPTFLKYNVIRDGGVFSVKAGAIPLFKIEQLSASDTVALPNSAVLGVLGLGASSYVGRATALVLDLSAFQKFGDARDGIIRNGASLGLGLSYDI